MITSATKTTSASSLADAREQWNLLRILHPLFSESLPTIHSLGQTGTEEEALAHLNNEITRLRSEIRLNIIRLDQHQDDFEQLTDGLGIEELVRSAGILLEAFENLIDDEILCEGGISLDIAGNVLPAVGTAGLIQFPKVRALEDLLYQHKAASQLEVVGIRTPLLDADTVLANDSSSGSSKRDIIVQSQQLAGFVRFPENEESIAMNRKAVEQFGDIVMKVFRHRIRERDIELRIQRFSKSDIAILQNAFTFSSAYGVLFELIYEAIGDDHQAKVYLCDIQSDQLKVAMNTCQVHGWNSATFKRSVYEQPTAPFLPDQACAWTAQPECGSQTRSICFNDNIMWEEPNAPDSIMELSADVDGYTLNDLLGRAASAPNSEYFTPQHRKLLSYLLSFTLLQLFGSPWIKTYLRHDTVSLYPIPDYVSRLDQWKPYLHCLLAKMPDELSMSNYMAAFGTLIMELEANQTAEWTEDDNDWELETKSYQVRLGRILKEWEDTLRDDYRLIGEACRDFESLVETFDNPNIDPKLKQLAVVYKCILQPLYQILLKDFGSNPQLFQGIPTPWRSVPSSTSSTVARRELFDDFETTGSDKKVKYAKDFMQELGPFLGSVLSSRLVSRALPTGPAQSRERIRIVVLDSGVDAGDDVIRGAIKQKRIVARKSWVGNDEDHHDTYGHGTHVVRLLRKTAPTADIYVGKICNGKYINDEFMPGIAKAIDWAVNECNAHILSLSFGFRDAHTEVDEAIGRAIQQGTLVLAAASNGGGLRPRTRPASHPDVICIHACDGLGNNGDMSPTPLANEFNFTTLGIGVPSQWHKDGKREHVWKSGTSFATPIAAGFAANILDFADFHCNLDDHQRAILQKRRGMVPLFNRMSVNRDGYNFIHPNRLWDGRKDEQVAEEIKQIIQNS